MATFTLPVRGSNTKMDLNTTQNLVDAEWELIDPVPDIHILFHTFNGKFFKGALACVELEWSKRMYQCAGICYSKSNRSQMSCVIRLSEPLLKLRSRKELIETLLHEMIHAWNFIRGIMEENGGHGQNFLSKMNEINRLAGTNITVYHSFHDEVELYKTHWWRCDGPCKSRKPYFGFVKRTSNRAPSKNDSWWSQHQTSCGGTFIKVKEPEKKAKKPAAKRVAMTGTKKPKTTTSGNGDIRKYFDSDASISELEDSFVNGSDSLKPPAVLGNNNNIPPSNEAGKKLGGSGNGRSRLLDLFEKQLKKDQVVTSKRKRFDESEEEEDDDKLSLKSPPIRKSILQQIKNEFYCEDDDDDDDDDGIIFIDDEYDDSLVMPKPLNNSSEVIEIATSNLMCNCPICNIKVPSDFINQHLDECLSIKFLSNQD